MYTTHMAVAALLLASSSASAFSFSSLLATPEVSYPKIGVTGTLMQHGRQLLMNAPTPAVVHGARWLGTFAPLISNDTFVGSFLDRLQASAALLHDIPTLAKEGRLAKTVRHARRMLLQGASVVGRRTSEVDYFNLAESLDSLRNEFLCNGNGPTSQEIKDSFDELLDDISPGNSATLGPSVATIDQAISCFCNIDVSSSSLQAAADLAIDLINGQSKTAEQIYDAISDSIEAIFSTNILCHSDCKLALEQMMVYSLATGTLVAEEILGDLSSETVSIAKNTAEEEAGLAETTPACMCSVQWGSILTNVKTPALALSARLEDLISGDTSLTVGDGSIPALRSDIQAVFRVLLGENGFLGNLGYCSGDCRSWLTWLVDLELTWVTGFPFSDLVDAASRRRLSSLPAPVESSEQQLAVPKRSRALSTAVYDPTIDEIKTAAVNCVCEYLDYDELIGKFDIMTDDWFDRVSGTTEQAIDAVFEIDKAVVADWFFSWYGVCGGYTDGCVKTQTELGKLIGLIEENWATGGVLFTSGVLASTSPNLLSTVLPTVAPCYCNLDYGHMFDALEPFIKDVWEDGNVTDVENLVGAKFSALSISGWAIQTLKTCLSDYCKTMMASVYSYFADIMILGGEASQSPQCTSAAASACTMAAAGAGTWFLDSACSAPAQASWLGSVSSDSMITSSELWAYVYWVNCMFKSYCPSSEVSSYDVVSSIEVADAASVDTIEEQVELKATFVNMLNTRLGYGAVRTSDVAIAVVGTTVTFTITAESEVLKTGAETVLAPTDTTSVAMLCSGTVACATEATLTGATVTAVVYSPPPPAPGYNEGAGGGSGSGSSDDSDDNLPIIIGAAAGGAACCCLVAIGLMMVMMRKKPKVGAEKTPL